MAITRKGLKALGIEEDKIEVIIEQHGETVEGLKGQIKKAQTVAETPKPEVPKIKPTDKETKEPVGNNQEFEELKKEIQKLKADKEISAKRKAYKSQVLDQINLSAKVSKKLLGLVDFSQVELDGIGGIKGLDELVESVKTEWSDFVLEKSEKGIETPNPLGDTPKKTYTKEEIEKMSSKEINANWETIKQSLNQ